MQHTDDFINRLILGDKVQTKDVPRFMAQNARRRGYLVDVIQESTDSIYYQFHKTHKRPYRLITIAVIEFLVIIFLLLTK